MITSINEFKKHLNERLYKDAHTEYEDMSEKTRLLEEELQDKYPVDLSLSFTRSTIILSRIFIEKKDRNKGIGTKVMNEICDFADENRVNIALSPSSDFGGSKSRLIPFYKSFGFVNNKGSHRFIIRETMIRYPQN
jgi:GNAT superfamily N-acetyltransferase